MNKSFSESLKQNNLETWNKIFNHKFIVDIAKDVLPIAKFAFYLKQDKIFLGAYCDLLNTASRVADDNENKLWFESLIESTTKYEIAMQDEILQLLDKNYLESVSAEETTREYIDYINSVSNSKDLALIVSTIAPCPWIYYEISNALIKKDVKPDAFKKWLQFYSSNESVNQVKRLKQVLNNLGQKADEKKKIKMMSYFSTACKYELKFWDMAYSFHNSPSFS